jgi:hypothetical protein
VELYWLLLLELLVVLALLVVVVGLQELEVDLMLFQLEDLHLQDQMVEQHQV